MDLPGYVTLVHWNIQQQGGYCEQAKSIFKRAKIRRFTKRKVGEIVRTIRNER